MKIKGFLFFILCLLLNGFLFAQESLTGLYYNYQAAQHAKNIRNHKTTFIYYEPITLPFVDDFSNYRGFPDTALWIGNQAFVNDNFAINPPTIGVVTLDALNSQGAVYEHASVSPFSADTLLSKPVRLDSIFYPLPRALEISDSLYFSFFYQPGGGEGQAWEGLGNAPEAKDSLILEFGYQTGNKALLYYITQELYLADSVDVGDTIWSPCDPTMFIVADRFYYAGETIEMPCDSVVGMETIWEKVWATQGMTLSAFKNLYGTYFRQVMIPITERKYLNKGFQFRFRNIASLEYQASSPSWASNVDQWNIDYVRLNRSRTSGDTIIDDVAIVNYPESILNNYTAMPWSHFATNQKGFLRSGFSLKLTNLYNVVKNTTYDQRITDVVGNVIGSLSGGSYNISPFYVSGYQDYAPHAKPSLANITFPTTSNDSLEIFVYHVFREAGMGDNNPKNDTAVYKQCFFNYFAYDDGVPESGYVVTSSVYPYETSLAVRFSMAHQDTLRAVRMYVNRALQDANKMNFTLTVWNDNNGQPGSVIYSEPVQQSYSPEIYGLQQFYLQNPVAVVGTIYIGYQLTGRNFLNIGFDQNNNASSQVFWRTNADWNNSFIVGSPIIRAVVGADFDYTSIKSSQIAQDISSSIRVFPNPAKHTISIVGESQMEEDCQVEIFSTSGQCVLKDKTTQNIDVSALIQGFYLLKITDGQGHCDWAKFVISK